MVTQGKKFLAAHDHPDPTEYYAPLAKSLSNTETQERDESSSLPSPVDNNDDDEAVLHSRVVGVVHPTPAQHHALLRLRGSDGTLPGADLILDPLPDLKSRPCRSSYSEQDMETSPDLSLSPNSDYSTGENHFPPPLLFSCLTSCLLSFLFPSILPRFLPRSFLP